MAVTVKNLASKAMIVRLHQGSGPVIHKKDKGESTRLNAERGAKQDVASVTKRLFGKEQTAKVVRAYGNLKSYFTTHTMPWNDDGDRLLPAEKFFDFMQQVREYMNDAEDAEIRRVIDARGTDSPGYFYVEEEFNAYGYVFLGRQEVADAIRLFEINVELFPQSGNGHDSLGEALAASGDVESALASYRRSLELNPESESGLTQVDRLQAIVDES